MLGFERFPAIGPTLSRVSILRFEVAAGYGCPCNDIWRLLRIVLKTLFIICDRCLRACVGRSYVATPSRLATCRLWCDCVHVVGWLIGLDLGYFLVHFVVSSRCFSAVVFHIPSKKPWSGNFHPKSTGGPKWSEDRTKHEVDRSQCCLLDRNIGSRNKRQREPQNILIM